MLQRSFLPAIFIALVMLAAAPWFIVGAPYESTMGLIQKIFYYHVPSWMVMFTSTFVCGIASAMFLAKRKPGADHVAVAAAELVIVFGLIGLITGPIWARKAWGVWWQWDARLTSALVLWMIFAAYLLLRKYGGPGSDRLAAGLALFGMANVPFVYWSVNVWRTLHPKTSVVPSLHPGMRPAFYWCTFAMFALYVALMAARTRLEAQRARLDALYLSLED